MTSPEINDTVIKTVNGPVGLLSVGDFASAVENACVRWEEENEDDSIYQLHVANGWSFAEFIAACLTEVGWTFTPPPFDLIDVTVDNSELIGHGCVHGYATPDNCPTCTPVVMCTSGNHRFLDIGQGLCSCGNGKAGKVWNPSVSSIES